MPTDSRFSEASAAANRPSSNSADVVVVGGGAVGLSTAWYLAEAGARVTVVDRMSLRDKASIGNAGLLVPSHVIPLSAPGVISKGLRWMLSARSPFHISPRLSADFLRWLWLFARHATPEHVAYGIPILRDLSMESLRLFDALCGEDLAAANGGGADGSGAAAPSGQATQADSAPGIAPPLPGTGYSRTGLLMLHRGDTARRDNLHEADLAEGAGLDLRRLSEPEARALEPDIRTEISGGVFYATDAAIHPERFLSVMETALRARGVQFVDATALRLDRQVGVVLDGAAEDGRRSIGGDFVVVAAGAWTPHLVKTLGTGLRLPVEPARGYSLTVNTHEAAIRIPCVMLDERITVTPMAGALRFSGTLTLSGFDRRVEERRMETIRRLAQLYAGPSLAIEKPAVWTGFRPASADGLPIIGPIPGAPRFSVATGHGMLGVTQAPVTGRLMADLLAGRSPILDPTPFAPGRFA